jgi:Bromodomain
MRSALVTLVEAIPSSLPVLWITTVTCKQNVLQHPMLGRSVDLRAEDERLAKLIHWFSGSSDLDRSSYLTKSDVRLNGESQRTVILEVLTKDDRIRAFSNYFSDLHLLPSQLYDARMQVIKARIQIHKPCIPEVEKPIVLEHPSSPQGSRNRSLRSGLSCKNQGRESAPRQQPVLMTEDGDKQCVRELRNFLRATLGELHKEKKCLVFWRPVDPENVPDYYDVISCPMDLETMRMKVSSTYNVRILNIRALNTVDNQTTCINLLDNLPF